MTLSEKIAYLRKREGMSQEDLAEKLSISRQSIYKWEIAESLPSIDNIKNLAKIFGVSFDYLLDETIDNANPTNSEVRPKVIERDVFFTGTKLHYNQINIDNGYDESRKADLKRKGYSDDNISLAQSELKKLGIKDVFQIQHNAATFFFYDSRNYTCGFFYAGMIQFVCPIENILGFTYGGGNHKVVNSSTTVGGIGIEGGEINSVAIGQMPRVTSLPDTSAWGCLSYKDGDKVESLEMDFYVNNMYMAQFCKDAESLETMWLVTMDALIKNLEKLRLKISSLVDIGKDIKCGNIAIQKVDFDIFTKANEALKPKYSAYLKQIKDEAIRDNKKRLIKKIVIGAVLTLTLLLFFILIIFYFDSKHMF